MTFFNVTFKVIKKIIGGEMEINLNNRSEFTIHNIRRLIASRPDDVRCQLRVTTEGKAYLSEVVGDVGTGGLAFRFDTWLADSGRKGLKASEDEEWVLLIYNCLKSNWPNPSSSYIDMDEYSPATW